MEVHQSLWMLLFFFSNSRIGGATFVTDEEGLRTAVLNGYSTKVRPDHKTVIYVTGILASLNHLDIDQQSMSVNILLGIAWFDGRLTWTPTDHGDLNDLVTPPEDIWTPPIVVENAAADLGVVGGADNDGTPVRITSEGFVSWTPPMTVVVSCEMHIANYPLDTQVCEIILLGWTYPLSEMNVTINEIDTTTLYSNHGEFDLLSTYTHYQDIGGPGEDNTYRKIYMEFKFRRRWQFYGQNLLMPIVLNSILMNAVFALPLESGEKMGYSLTVLLSYIVFLTWVTENLPPVSTDTSILQVYLAVVLCLGCLATLLTTWVLRLYHKTTDMRMNVFYRKFASAILVPFFAKVHGGHERFGKNKTKVAPLSDNRKGDKDDGAEKEREDTPVPTWQELSLLMDYFFLWVFGSALVILTTIIFALLYANY